MNLFTLPRRKVKVSSPLCKNELDFQTVIIGEYHTVCICIFPWLRRDASYITSSRKRGVEGREENMEDSPFKLSLSRVVQCGIVGTYYPITLIFASARLHLNFKCLVISTILPINETICPILRHLFLY